MELDWEVYNLFGLALFPACTAKWQQFGVRRVCFLQLCLSYNVKFLICWAGLVQFMSVFCQFQLTRFRLLLYAYFFLSFLFMVFATTKRVRCGMLCCRMKIKRFLGKTAHKIKSVADGGKYELCANFVISILAAWLKKFLQHDTVSFLRC